MSLAVLAVAAQAAQRLHEWNSRMPDDRGHPQGGNWGGARSTWLAEGVMEVSAGTGALPGFWITGRDLAGRALAPVSSSDPAASTPRRDGGPPSLSGGGSGRPGWTCAACRADEHIDCDAFHVGDRRLDGDSSLCTCDHGQACSYCGKAGVDKVGLSIAGATPLDIEELGFCSTACLVLFVRRRFIEAVA